MSDVKRRCAACRKEKPVSEMKVCMHSQMHYYVCDAKCMHDFYNPPKAKKPDHDAAIAALQSRLDAAEAERDQLRAELEAANKRADINAWNHRHAKQDLQTARNRIAELEAIRGQPSAALVEAVRELIGAANSVNRSRMHEVRGHDDDQPRYWQRKEWVDWLVENGEKAQQALDALPPQQPDAVSVPRELAQEALEMAIDDAEEHQCSPCFNPTRQRVLDAQVERWRALLTTKTDGVV